MEVRSDRRYRFAVGPEALWAAITDVEQYRLWWPWLRGFEAQGLVVGDAWRCVVQPPLPYTLRFTVTLDEVVEPRLVRATVSGEIVGTARLDIAEDGDGGEMRLTSSLSPDNRMLRAVASVARPVVRFGHDWVLDTGARQFAAAAAV